VDVVFDETELDALEQLSNEMGSGQARLEASVVTLRFRMRPLAGLKLESEPDNLAARECFVNASVLQRIPSLDLVFLPAERRLLPPNSNVVDLAQLAEEMGRAKLAEARGASANYGRLDDSEFETFAKALCVAGSLPSERQGEGVEGEESRWLAFKASVDELIHPKYLKPLTRENPSELLVGLPGGGSHRIHELSSGERQALIIISRVFRGGEGQSIIAIDEPDAYLHPALSARLLKALRLGLAEGGRLIMATHSPAILDGLAPDAIFRLSHDSPAQLVATEDDRLALYRAAGFRASALTQSDFLLRAEGDFDATLLPQLIIGLSNASVLGSGGRAQVFRSLEALRAFDLPIVGVVDADVDADPVPESVADICHVWAASDIEAVLLSDDAFLQAAIDGKLVQERMSSLEAFRQQLMELITVFREQAIAELAQRKLRASTNIRWPSPRGDTPLERLRALAGTLPQLAAADIDAVIEEAEASWEAAGPLPFKLVRGKWVMPKVVSELTSFRTVDGFVNAVVARQPEIAEIQRLAALIDAQRK
jgi:predicted ATPase